MRCPACCGSIHAGSLHAGIPNLYYAMTLALHPQPMHRQIMSLQLTVNYGHVHDQPRTAGRWMRHASARSRIQAGSRGLCMRSALHHSVCLAILCAILVSAQAKWYLFS